MPDRPIIFSAPMVRALLEGRKTQTRRVIKWQGARGYPHSFEHARIDNPAGVPRLLVPFHHPDEPHEWDSCPMHRHYGPADPGDRLYVREAHALVPATAYRASEGLTQVADPDDRDRACIYREGFDRSTGGIRWRPSIHMPRWASRITLTVTEVRVQRLQGITWDDAIAEGCPGVLGPAPDFPDEWDPAPDEQFRDLWNSLHGPNAWDANPWIVAVSFTVRKGNIDQETTP